MQPSPDGLAQAFILGEEFLDGDDACLEIISSMVMDSQSVKENNATVFGYYVSDPERYGFNDEGTVISIEEKPKSNYAVVGLYPNDVVQKAKPSDRGDYHS